MHKNLNLLIAHELFRIYKTFNFQSWFPLLFFNFMFNFPKGFNDSKSFENVLLCNNFTHQKKLNEI